MIIKLYNKLDIVKYIILFKICELYNIKFMIFKQNNLNLKSNYVNY